MTAAEPRELRCAVGPNSDPCDLPVGDPHVAAAVLQAQAEQAFAVGLAAGRMPSVRRSGHTLPSYIRATPTMAY